MTACTDHAWRLVEVDSSEHGDIGRFVCTVCGEERLSLGVPADEDETTATS